MILNEAGQTIKADGKVFEVGERVISLEHSDFGGLEGFILEIRTESDKETENEGIDIHVCFDVPTNKKKVKELEERFSNLYREPIKIGDIALDLVVMTPDELEPKR